MKYDYLADESRFRYYLNRVEPYVTEKPFPHPWLGRSAFENGPVTVGPGAMVSEREVRRATAAYYANVERIDDQFASVVHELHEAGEDIDDWIIVYAGDHGEMLGQHSIWEKQKFFEASARVPLIIRYPRRFAGARHVHSNVNLIDLFATLCELTNTPVPEGLHSRSLVPLMDGNTADWDSYTMSQFDGWSRMIKRDHYKFQQFDGRYPGVLFDLKTDPGETRNFADDPAYADVVKRLRDELSQAVQR